MLLITVMLSERVDMIQKTNEYADQPERFQLQSFEVILRGNHHDHTIIFQDGRMKCSCNSFSQNRFCEHVRAVEQYLNIEQPARALER